MLRPESPWIILSNANAAHCLTPTAWLLALSEGRMSMEMTVAPWMMAPNGYLHAASLVMLADTGYATMAHLPEGAKGFTTLELKSNFLGTAREGVLSVEAIADHMGRSTQIWSANVVDARPQAGAVPLLAGHTLVIVG